MRKALAVLAAVLLVAALAGCDDETQFVPGPGPVQGQGRHPRAARAQGRRPAWRTACPAPAAARCPEITLPCLGGGTSVDLSSLRGPLVLSFWYAGCEPCKEEMPALQAFHDQYGDRVPVIGVDFQDQYPGSALEEARKRGVTYPSLADPGGDLQGFDEFAKIPGHADDVLRRRGRRDRLPASPAASTPPTRSPTWSASTSESTL